MLQAGYMQDWQYHETLSGTPQGGIVSPLLANVYLNELDRFVVETLAPEYSRGTRRREHPEHHRVRGQIRAARKRNDITTVRQLQATLKVLPSSDDFDPDFRRLKYIRYADDFLIGYIGPKADAEEIRQRFKEFLGQRLRLNLSLEKTRITHARDEKARFLGYDIRVNGRQRSTSRTIFGKVTLLVPHDVVTRVRRPYVRSGRVSHVAALLDDSDFTIVSRFQSVLRGLYNYYCMASDVSRQIATVKWILEIALTKTLAYKHRMSVNEVFRRYQVVTDAGYKALRVTVERPGKTPLVAEFGGLSLARIPEGLGLRQEFIADAAWRRFCNHRSELVQRLLHRACELCGAVGDMEVHHIRKLDDLRRAGRPPKAAWECVMSARRRKTLVVCDACHDAIHHGEYDGQPLS
jgi:hypothetical protein